MTQGKVAALAAFVTLAFCTPSMAQSGGCWKPTDSTKMYGYMAACPAPAKQARRPSRTDERGTQVTANQQFAMQPSGQCWKATDSTKMYGYWQECATTR